MYTPKMARPNVISVSQLNRYIKSVIDHEPRLRNVFLSGEISNFNHHSSGHLYFSLKDEHSVIRAVMFAGNARRLKFRPQDSIKVICCGEIAVYEKTGQYQIYVTDMQPDGMGALALAFEQLKQRLEAQGLFAPAHKKPLPRFPKTVGVITSPTGAAVQDIRNILYRRYPCVNMLLYPVPVQGDGAVLQLVNALQRMDTSGLCDVIIIGRGGGSAEDLWAFNDEALAHAVYSCKTPVISAVGHEIDFTICDFVADMRAPTPSAAAELAVPNREELMAYYRSQAQYLSRLADNRLRGEDNLLLRFRRRMEYAGPEGRSQRLLQHYQLTAKKLEGIFQHKISENELKLRRNAAKLETLNPLAVLARGYTMTEQDGAIVKTAAQLNKEKPFTLTFADGKLLARVEETLS